MKKIFFLLIFPLFLYAQILTEKFESGTLPDGWSITNGIVNYDENPLQGNYSCQLDGSGGTIYTITFSPVNEVWVHLMTKMSDITPSSDNIFFRFRLSGSNINVYMNQRTSGLLYIYDLGAYANAGYAFSANVKYHVWVHYVASSGADNGIFALYYSETNIRPESPNTTITNGGIESDIDQVFIHAGYGNEIICDWIIVSTSEIGDVVDNIKHRYNKYNSYNGYSGY